MLHTTSGLSRSVMKWVSQVTVSVGATLVATMIYSALPKPVFFASPTPPPELTSGGKFAARAVMPVAYDGLDAMPLPHVAPLPVVATPIVAEAPVAPMRRAAWDDTVPPVLVPERPARAAKPSRAVARVEPRRAVTTADTPAPLPMPAEPMLEVKAEGDLLPRIVPKVVPRILPTILSAARDAWVLTASAGDTLMAHVVPQIP